MSLRHAVRSLAGSPAFTLGSIACLSIGLALTIAAYSVVNAAFFGSLPGVHDRASLRNIWIETPRPHGRMVTQVSVNEYRAYQSGLADVADVAAHTRRTVSLQFRRTPLAARAVYVSSNYFSLLGTQPQLGTLAVLDREHAVVSDGFWRHRMDARPDAIGEIIHVNRRPFIVTAIAPPKFNGASPGELENDPARVKGVWLPLDALRAEGDADPTGRWISMVARLKHGTEDSHVASRATAIAASLTSSGSARIRAIHQGPYDDPADVAAALAVVMSVPFGILAIACANVANLLLARGTARTREVAVRLALGASRQRIVLELLIESVLLATAAAVSGLALCAAAVRILSQWIPLSIAVDWRVAAFALATGVVTAIAFGLWPALGFSRTPMTLRLHDLRPVRTRTRRLLVAAQLALSTTLVVVAALLARVVADLTRAGERADEAQVLAVSLNLELGGYEQTRGEPLITAITERIRTLPGVVAAGSAPDGPFHPRLSVLLWEPGHARDRQRYARGSAVTDGWFEAAGVRLVAGRDFTPQDRRGAPAAVVVSESLVRSFWPEGGALGRTLLLTNPLVNKGPRYTVQVVGVVSDATTDLTYREPAAVAYLPSPISYEPVRSVWARTSGAAQSIIPQVHAVVSSLAPDVPIAGLTTVADARARDAGPYRWLSQGMAAAGLLSLLLAALGLFALLTYLVAQRRREVGIRMALGARRKDIVRLVIGESAVVCVSGALVGGLAGLGVAATLLRDMVRTLDATDPVALAVAAGVLFVTAFAASAHPALRAARTDPALVLRAE